MLLFFLTILLAGMLLSQLIEEKSNKIIEVIAAAVPIDAIFLGKLFAMLAASVVGIIVWISAGALLIQLISTGGVRRLPPPAVGWPGFLALGIVYFAMNYLLLGAVFLTIGAQASTVREVQTLSMPVTFGQVADLRLRLARDRRSRIPPRGWPPRSSRCPRRWRCSRAPPRSPAWWPHLVAHRLAGGCGSR